MKEMQQQYGMAQKKEPEINNTKYDLRKYTLFSRFETGVGTNQKN
jgi:hypothetical protein